MTSKSTQCKGILDQINLAAEPNYFKATRALIIGPSASGKTTLAVNIAVYIVKHFNNLIIISPSIDDQNLRALTKFCKEAKLNVLWTTIDDHGNLNIPVDIEKFESKDKPNKNKYQTEEKIEDKKGGETDNNSDVSVASLSKSLFIIDDFYSQRGMPKSISTLISSLFIKGRHNKNNIIYIAHSNRNIPHEVKLGCNMLFIDRPYDNIPLSEEIENDDFSEWYQLDSYTSPSTINVVKFSPISRDVLIRKLKDKIHSEDKGKKLASIKDYMGIAIQGNDRALKTVKKTSEMKVSNKPSVGGQLDPISESSYKLFC